MNSETSCASAQKTTALYNGSFFRKLLHSRPVAHAMARALGSRLCGRLMGRLLLPFVSTDQINVLAVSREMLAKDTEQIGNRTDINFIPDERYRDHTCWANGVALLKELFAVLEKKAPVPAAVTANVGYWQEEPLRRFCTGTGVQRLVVDRENHIVPEYRGHMRDLLDRSRVIAGFNTISLAEKMLFARTEEPFHEQLEHALSSTAVVGREARLRRVNRYMMFTPGETASERTAKLIAELAAKR